MGFTVEPIGFFKGGGVHKYEAPRQGVFEGISGTIELLPHHDYETALRDLDGFSRIWILFLFDRNLSHWRPTAHPPVTAPHRPRVGVFASRAPYRPNPIGLSCVKLDQIKGRTLFISEADLLNDTPILDIKPYIPAADAFPHARAGWVEEQTLWRVLTTPLFDAQAAEILSRDHFDLAATARLQLAGEPFDSARKRVRRTSDTTGILCVQYYRISFEVDAPTQTILVTSVTQVSATD